MHDVGAEAAQRAAGTCHGLRGGEGVPRDEPGEVPGLPGKPELVAARRERAATFQHEDPHLVPTLRELVGEPDHLRLTPAVVEGSRHQRDAHLTPPPQRS